MISICQSSYLYGIVGKIVSLLILILMMPGLFFAKSSTPQQLQQPPRQAADAYINLLREEKDTAKAAAHLRELKPLAQKINQPYYWGKYHWLQGRVANAKQRYVQALRSYFAAIPYLQRKQTYNHLSAVYLDLGSLYARLRNHHKAIEYYQNGLYFGKQAANRNTPQLVMLYAYLAQSHEQLYQFKAALKYLNTGENLATVAKSPRGLCEILSEKGRLLQAQQQHSAAFTALQRAQTLAHKHRFRQFEMQNLQALCLLELYLGKPDAAWNHALRQQQLARALRDSNYLTISNHLLARTFFKRNQYDSAFQYNSLALKMTQDADTSKRRIHLFQAAIVEKQGDLEKSWFHLEEASKLVATKNDLWEEINVLRNEEELRQKIESKLNGEKALRKWLLYGCGLLLLLGLGYWIRARFKQKSNRLLSAQNEVIEGQKLELEEMSQMKNQLFAIVSHDLRSPLLSMRVVLDTLKKLAPTDSERPWWMERLYQQSAKTGLLLENLLCWANLQMNNYFVEQERFLLLPLVQEVTEAVALVYADKSIQVSIQIDNDLEMYGDPAMIRMALRNILANACKFSDEGQSVLVSAVQTDEHVSISIQDQGMGMDRAQLDKALHGQLRRDGTKGELGLGIGLSLVRRFIEHQGGSLEGESEPDQGCTFTILLPQQNFQYSPENLNIG